MHKICVQLQQTETLGPNISASGMLQQQYMQVNCFTTHSTSLMHASHTNTHIIVMHDTICGKNS